MDRMLNILTEMKNMADELKASPNRTIQERGFEVEQIAHNLIFTFTVIAGKTGHDFNDTRRQFEKVFDSK